MVQVVFKLILNMRDYQLLAIGMVSFIMVTDCFVHQWSKGNSNMDCGYEQQDTQVGTTHDEA